MLEEVKIVMTSGDGSDPVLDELKFLKADTPDLSKSFPEDEGPEGKWHHVVAPIPPEYQAAHDFMSTVFGADGYTPDAIGQLVEVFIPCLSIMCERGYEPSGWLWKKSGLLSSMIDVRKKFERYWYRTWTQGKRHDDSGIDLINFTAFSLRQDPESRFGDLGEPSPREDDSE